MRFVRESTDRRGVPPVSNDLRYKSCLDHSVRQSLRYS